MAPSKQAKWAGKPDEEELERRNTVNILKETVTNTVSTDFPGHFPGEDHAFSIDRFRSGFNIDFHQNDPSHASFSLVGIDASLANAFRRILISEIPTLAIENVYISNNTSVIQDEVLAHRLGLIPLKGGREGLRKWFQFHKKPEPGEDQYSGTNDTNTIELNLQVTCTHNEDAAPNEKDPLKAYHNAHVYARDITFNPQGGQAKYFSGEDAIAPVNPDILIAKMRPRQTIDLMMHAHLGVGSDHAKFSPVATASYRLMPTIKITEPILGADAVKFANCFPEGVIGLEKVSKKEAGEAGSGYEGQAGQTKAVVRDPMKDTVSREALRHPEFEGKVKLGRRRDHFIFSIESTGQWESDELFIEAVKQLKLKAKKLEVQVENMVL